MSERIDEPPGDPGEDDVEQIGAYLDGRLSSAELRALEERLLHSDRLAAALYAQMNLRAALAQPAPAKARAPLERTAAPLRPAGASSRARRPLWRQPRMLLPLAAALALLIVLPRLLSGPAERPPVLRGADRTPVALNAVGDLATPPSDFQWTANPLADRYRFRLFDAQGHLLFETITRDPVATLEPGAVAWPSIAQGHWTVTPLAGDGTELPASEPQRFRLVGP